MIGTYDKTSYVSITRPEAHAPLLAAFERLAVIGTALPVSELKVSGRFFHGTTNSAELSDFIVKEGRERCHLLGYKSSRSVSSLCILATDHLEADLHHIQAQAEVFSGV